jgi:hypothetical protein
MCAYPIRASSEGTILIANPSRDPFPINPDDPVETHQLTVRALVVGAALGCVGEPARLFVNPLPNSTYVSRRLQHLLGSENRLYIWAPAVWCACLTPVINRDYELTPMGSTGHLWIFNHQGDEQISSF